MKQLLPPIFSRSKAFVRGMFQNPRSRFLVPLSLLMLWAGMFAMTVQADSTITIPVPHDVERGKNVTLSLRIPPPTEPVTRKITRPKLASRKSLIIWNSNPSPKMKKNDEFFRITQRFMRKGWVKSYSARTILNMRPLDVLHAIRALENINDCVIEVAQAPNFTRILRKINLTTSDIQDLRRLNKRFERDLRKFGHNTKLIDKDLLMLQERMKKARQGILKVIRVEGEGDGSTVIHLTVD